MSRPILLGATLVIIFLFLATYGDLTATPKFWHDEAVPFEIARNIAEFGKADLAVAPNIFWEKSYMTHATGFPLTFPLAGIFKIFGVGIAQSRIFMIAWMFATLVTLFFVMRAFFDARTAFFSVLLVATFSSFYANGRTGTGEIPGFFFLLIALYFLYQKEWYGWGGFFAALAAVTKPSMYLLVFPAIVLELLISASKKTPSIFTGLRARSGHGAPTSVGASEGEPSSPFAFWAKAREFFNARHHRGLAKIPTEATQVASVAGLARKVKMLEVFLISAFLGALPVLLFWLWLINPAPFNIASWQEMIAFYQNAFNAPSLLSQFPTIIPNLFTHSTILYFVLLFFPIILAWRKKIFSPAQNRLAVFLFLYGAASFFYFLRSPGWFRYLLGTELLILALLPTILLHQELRRIMPGVFAGFERGAGMVRARLSKANGGRESEARNPERRTLGGARKAKIPGMILLLGIAIFQSSQYLLGAEIPSGTKSIEIAKFINAEVLAHDQTATIGIVGHAPIAALISADRKYQRVAVGGYDTFVGKHALSLPPDQLPAYFISTNAKKNEKYEYILQTFYQPYRYAPHNTLIYKKN